MNRIVLYHNSLYSIYVINSNERFLIYDFRWGANENVVNKKELVNYN